MNKLSACLVSGIGLAIVVCVGWFNWIQTQMNYSAEPGVWASAYIAGETEVNFAKRHKLVPITEEQVLMQPPCENPTLLGMCDPVGTAIYAEHGWRFMKLSPSYIAQRKLVCTFMSDQSGCS
jgi:hypothetical protein